MKFYFSTYDNYLQESKTYEIDADNTLEARTILIDKLVDDLDIEYPEGSFYDFLDMLANKHDLMVIETELIKL